MKKLVTGKTVQDFANENRGKNFPVDEDTLITPNAKDTAYALGVKFIDKAEMNNIDYSSLDNEKKAEPCDDSKDCVDIDLDRQQVVKAVIEVLAAKGLI